MNLSQFFRDKHGNLSFRELCAPILLLTILGSLIGAQFFGQPVEPTMFLTLVGAFSSCQFGYSIEKPLPQGGTSA